MGHNELLVGRAVAGRRDKVQLSVKFGALRGPDGSWLGVDTRPAAVKNFAAYSLKRLGVDVIDVYRPARLDPAVPIEETIGAIADLVKAGYVRHIGLSEVGVETIRRAHAVHPIVDLQIEYSLASRGPEAQIFPALGRARASAPRSTASSRAACSPAASPRARGDFRAYLPRFSGEHGAKNETSSPRSSASPPSAGLTPASSRSPGCSRKQARLRAGGRREDRRRSSTTSLAALDTPLSRARPRGARDVLVPQTRSPASATAPSR